MTATILAILTSPGFLAILGTIATAAFTAFQGSAWWARNKNTNYELAIHVMKAAALKLMPLAEKYKKDTAGGKLTEAQIADLNARLIADVEAIGKTMGVDVLRTIGPEFLKLAIHEIVSNLKGVPKLPDSVVGLLR